MDPWESVQTPVNILIPRPSRVHRIQVLAHHKPHFTSQFTAQSINFSIDNVECDHVEALMDRIKHAIL